MGQGVREVEQGRDSRFQRLADLTLNCGAWSQEWLHVLTVTAEAGNHTLAVMRRSFVTCGQTYAQGSHAPTYVHLHMSGIVRAYGHTVFVCCVCVPQVQLAEFI